MWVNMELASMRIILQLEGNLKPCSYSGNWMEFATHLGDKKEGAFRNLDAKNLANRNAERV